MTVQTSHSNEKLTKQKKENEVPERTTHPEGFDFRRRRKVEAAVAAAAAAAILSLRNHAGTCCVHAFCCVAQLTIIFPSTVQFNF